MKLLVVFDFDHTIVDDNTDTHVMKLGEKGRIPDFVEAKHEEGHWTAFMNSVFSYLFNNCKISESQYESNLSKIPLTSGFATLMQYIDSNNSIDCIIISDSNTWFIDLILSKHGLSSVPQKVFTNNAEFIDGCLKVSPYHHHDHGTCPVNMCKRKVLDEFVNAKKEQGVRYRQIFYVGDGGNDFCPAAFLQKNDVVFARNGYALHEKLKTRDIHAAVQIWKSGLEILPFLEKFDGSQIDKST